MPLVREWGASSKGCDMLLPLVVVVVECGCGMACHRQQGGVTPIEPVQTLSTAVKILDRPK